MLKFVYNNTDIKFESVPGDYIAKSWKEGSFYESRLLEKIRSLDLKGTYVDLGAHHGNHSIFFSKFCPSEKVISIEGNPYNFSYLKKNIELNSCNVFLYNLIADQINDKKLIMQYNHQNTGCSRVVDTPSGKTITNNSITLDTLLSQEENISLVKIDIENYEYNALLGATSIITKHRPIIVIELHKTNPYYEEIRRYLSDYGYTTDGINYALSPTYFYYPTSKKIM